jgi:hypothetical protein
MYLRIFIAILLIVQLSLDWYWWVALVIFAALDYVFEQQKLTNMSIINNGLADIKDKN